MREVDFVGSDPGSGDERCPAVSVDPDTGDFYQQGRLVTDPEMLESLGQHVALAADEAVIWQPARMASILAEAATGSFEKGRKGHGIPPFAELLANSTRSAVHLEMRDVYGPEPAFEDWKAGGSGRRDRSRWIGLVEDAIARGVKMRRARIVSEPTSDYIRWGAHDHRCQRQGRRGRSLASEATVLRPDVAWCGLLDVRPTTGQIPLRCRRRDDAGGLRVRQRPRRVAQVVAAFEMVWERAIPHADYTPA